MKDRLEWVMIGGLIVGTLAMLWYAQTRPGLFSNSQYLGGVLLLEIIFICLWHYERAFLPFLMIVFLWAGMHLPLSETVGLTARWIVLGFGASTGCLMWLKHRRKQPLNAFHLMAFFCVTLATVSAIVSDFPDVALLKVLSLLMMFLYCSCGARYAIHGREEKFLQGLVVSCEVLVYLSSVSYFLLVYEAFGNRNALGAVIGVGTFPVVTWAALATDRPATRRRLTICLLLSGFMLFFSLSRASLIGAGVAGALLCVLTARRRALYKGVFYVVLFLTIMGAVSPGSFNKFLSSQTDAFLYKKDVEGRRVLASREGPWNDTVASIKKHPWFGSGFGTSDLGESQDIQISHTYSIEGSNREHGNSYLAMVEYMGLVGILPFAGLILLTVRNLWKVCAWMRRSKTVRHYVVPFAMVVVAGLVHALFEDWLFAVGSYLCLFFWICAFTLTDFVSAVLVPASARAQAARPAWPMDARLGVPAAGR